MLKGAVALVEALDPVRVVVMGGASTLTLGTPGVLGMSHLSPTPNVGCCSPAGIWVTRAGQQHGDRVWAGALREGHPREGLELGREVPAGGVHPATGRTLPVAPLGSGPQARLLGRHSPHHTYPASTQAKTRPKATRPAPAWISAPTPRSGLLGRAQRLRLLSLTQACPPQAQELDGRTASCGHSGVLGCRCAPGSTPHPSQHRLCTQVLAWPGCSTPGPQPGPLRLHLPRTARLEAGSGSWKRSGFGLSQTAEEGEFKHRTKDSHIPLTQSPDDRGSRMQAPCPTASHPYPLQTIQAGPFQAASLTLPFPASCC